MRYRFAFIMEIGSYSPKENEIVAESFEEAATAVKSLFQNDIPFGGAPKTIILTSDDFKGKAFDFNSLKVLDNAAKL